jgi:hypothetical protein
MPSQFCVWGSQSSFSKPLTKFNWKTKQNKNLDSNILAVIAKDKLMSQLAFFKFNFLLRLYSLIVAKKTPQRPGFNNFNLQYIW